MKLSLVFKCGANFEPSQVVGCVPGGKTAYPSTVLMTALPAIAAGVPEMVMCTPAGPDGKCNPVVLVAADICGVLKFIKWGELRLIAAMAYGTELFRVQKIVGPGNAFVTTAKIMVFGEVDIDVPAGPSEVTVIADETANQQVTADLLSQLEHGEDSQAVLVSDSQDFAKLLVLWMNSWPSCLARDIAEEARKIGFSILVEDIDEAVMYMADGYAPEHLKSC